MYKTVDKSSRHLVFNRFVDVWHIYELNTYTIYTIHWKFRYIWKAKTIMLSKLCCIFAVCQLFLEKKKKQIEQRLKKGEERQQTSWSMNTNGLIKRPLNATNLSTAIPNLSNFFFFNADSILNNAVGFGLAMANVTFGMQYAFHILFILKTFWNVLKLFTESVYKKNRMRMNF